jgi:hypothetical protein
MLDEWMIAITSNSIGVVIGALLTYILTHTKKNKIKIDSISSEIIGPFNPVKGQYIELKNWDKVERVRIVFYLHFFNRTEMHKAIVDPVFYIHDKKNTTFLSCVDLDDIESTNGRSIICNEFTDKNIGPYDYKKIRLQLAEKKELIKKIIDSNSKIIFKYKNENGKYKRITFRIALSLHCLKL